jgi:hypothetical protein
MVLICKQVIITGGKRKASDESQEKASPSAQEQTREPVVDKVAKTRKRMASRCDFCNRRVAISAVITCRCGQELCTRHRHADAHACKYDYRTTERQRAQKEVESLGTLSQKVVKI